MFDAKPFKKILMVAGSFNLKTIYRPPWLARNPKGKERRKREQRREGKRELKKAKDDEEVLKVLKQAGTCSRMIQDGASSCCEDA